LSFPDHAGAELSNGPAARAFHAGIDSANIYASWVKPLKKTAAAL
jgi:hypothetical protein